MKKVNFGQALEALKQGKIVRRDGWPPARFIFLNKGAVDFSGGRPVDSNLNVSFRVLDIHGVDADLFEPADRGTITRFPSITMQVDPTRSQPGWVPTQEDLFSEKWEIPEDSKDEACGCEDCRPRLKDTIGTLGTSYGAVNGSRTAEGVSRHR